MLTSPMIAALAGLAMSGGPGDARIREAISAAMKAAGVPPHPSGRIYTVKSAFEKYPVLQKFAARWEGILKREVNFTIFVDASSAKPALPGFTITPK